MGGKNLYKLFIDTGGFIALVDERDSFHQEARTFYMSLGKSTSLITSLLVISETYTWLRYQAGHDLASRFLSIIERAEMAGVLRVVLPDDAIRSNTQAVLKNYHDQNLSYTDAASFVILENMGISNVFGFDSHFYIINRNLWPSVKRS